MAIPGDGAGDYFHIGMASRMVRDPDHFVPIFLPMLDNFGVNPYFFAMLVALNLQTSFLTPPMAMSAYYLKAC